MKLNLVINGKKLEQEILKSVEFFKMLESNQCLDIEVESCIKDYIDVLLICHDVFMIECEN